MRRSIFIVVSMLSVLALLLSACAPAATETAQPTQAAAQPTEAPAEPTEATQPTEAPVPSTGLEDVDPGQVTGDIITAGSSTVYPLSESVVNLFKEEGYTGQITVDSIGSGAGFERFCVTGETDIANASRVIKDSEVESCRAIGREPIAFLVGIDAMALVVNPENDFLTDVTLEELAKIYSDQTETWADVNPEWPAEPIKRYSPGTDSGTYDYFIEAVMQPAYDKDADKAKEAFQNAANLQQSEDDNVLVQGVEGDKYAIGYFGFAYYQEQGERLKLVTINGVAPSTETAESGEYALARPLFIYSDAKVMVDKPQVTSFISFYLSRVNEVIGEVGYFPASDEALNTAKQALMDAVE